VHLWACRELRFSVSVAQTPRLPVPLPVTITSTKSAVPVRITNPPAADPIALAGLIVSISVLIVALGTLIAVFRQIYLAKLELRAVQQDLENNQQQMREFMRRPNLHARAAVTVDWLRDSPRRVELIVYVSNDGDRPAESHLFELLVPLVETMRTTLPSTDPMYRSIAGTSYYVDKHPAQGGTLYPNRVPAIYTFRFPVEHSFSEIVCLFRIYDLYGKYPTSGYGVFRIGTKTHMYDLGPEDGPLDA